MAASFGSASASVSRQVGAAAYSLRGISSDASSRPMMPTTSTGTATGRAPQPRPAAVGDDQLDLARLRAHDRADVAERASAVVEHRQADEVADAYRLRKAPLHALFHRHRLVRVFVAGRRHHGLGHHERQICAAIRRQIPASPPSSAPANRSPNRSPSVASSFCDILPIKNATRICEAVWLAKGFSQP